MSVIRMSKMHVCPHSQNPWQLALPLSSQVVVAIGSVAVGVDDGGGVVLLAATSPGIWRAMHQQSSPDSPVSLPRDYPGRDGQGRVAPQ